MNKIDTILLIHTGLVCHLVSAEYGFRNEKILAITFQIMIMLPLLCSILFLIVKGSRYQLLLKTLKNIYRKCKPCSGRINEEQLEDDFSSSVNSLSAHQVLIKPIALSGDIIIIMDLFNNST